MIINRAALALPPVRIAVAGCFCTPRCPAALRPIVTKESNMHIEPGYVASAKILAANLAAAALLGSQSIHLLKAPQLVVRSLIAGVLFLLFMQAFHQIGDIVILNDQEFA